MGIWNKSLTERGPLFRGSVIWTSCEWSESCHRSGRYGWRVEWLDFPRRCQSGRNLRHAPSSFLRPFEFLRPPSKKSTLLLLCTELWERSEMTPDAAKWNPNYKMFLGKNPGRNNLNACGIAFAIRIIALTMILGSCQFCSQHALGDLFHAIQLFLSISLFPCFHFDAHLDMRVGRISVVERKFYSVDVYRCWFSV